MSTKTKRMNESISSVPITRDGITMRQGSSGMIYITYADKTTARVFSGGRRLDGSTFDGFLRAASRDAAGLPLVHVFGAPERLAENVAAGMKAKR